MARRVRFPAFLLAAALLLPALAWAEPVAVLASVKGKVDVVPAKGGPAQPGRFGRPLERGDKVAVGAGGGATVFFSDGNVIELSEKSAVTISGKIASGKVGPAAHLPGEVFTQVSRYVTGGSRESGLVAMAALRGETLALLLSPRNTDVLDDKPTFRWRAAEGATRYRVKLSGDPGERWTREVSDTVLAWPADQPALAADADYLWEVEAYKDGERLRRESAAFHVLDPERAAAVRGNLDRIRESAGGTESAAQFLSGCYLYGCGLYRDAADRFTDLARISPGSPAPHEALGNVYRAVGLMDLAAAEFERALTLSRP